MDKALYIKDPTRGDPIHPLHQESLDQIANIYGQLVDKGFDEKALMVPRDPDHPEDHVLYLEFECINDSMRVAFDKLDTSLSDQVVADLLTRTAEFMKTTLSMLVFSGKGHYQEETGGI